MITKLRFIMEGSSSPSFISISSDSEADPLNEESIDLDDEVCFEIESICSNVTNSDSIPSDINLLDFEEEDHSDKGNLDKKDPETSLSECLIEDSFEDKLLFTGSLITLLQLSLFYSLF